MIKKNKIIIDTDPGVDDTMAIYFALRSPQIDVIGLTTIFGNVVHRPNMIPKYSKLD